MTKRRPPGFKPKKEIIKNKVAVGKKYIGYDIFLVNIPSYGAPIHKSPGGVSIFYMLTEEYKRDPRIMMRDPISVDFRAWKNEGIMVVPLTGKHRDSREDFQTMQRISSLKRRIVVALFGKAVRYAWMFKHKDQKVYKFQTFKFRQENNIVDGVEFVGSNFFSEAAEYVGKPVEIWRIP